MSFAPRPVIDTDNSQRGRCAIAMTGEAPLIRWSRYRIAVTAAFLPGRPAPYQPDSEARSVGGCVFHIVLPFPADAPRDSAGGSHHRHRRSGESGVRSGPECSMPRQVTQRAPATAVNLRCSAPTNGTGVTQAGSTQQHHELIRPVQLQKSPFLDGCEELSVLHAPETFEAGSH